MSRYLFQIVVLLTAAFLFAFWQRRERGRPAPIRDGFRVVRWSIGYRLISATFLIAILSGGAYLLWLELATDEKGVAAMWFLLIPLLALAFWGTIAGRVRNEYNGTTLIYYPMTGKSRTFALSDFKLAGPISWRGHEFSTETGDKIYVNTYQTGAPELLELLQRQVKQAYLE